MDLKDDPLIKEYIQNHNIKPNIIIRLNTWNYILQ